jgi:hypothetical protein
MELLWGKAVASDATLLIAEFWPPYNSTWQNQAYDKIKISRVFFPCHICTNHIRGISLVRQVADESGDSLVGQRGALRSDQRLRIEVVSRAGLRCVE